MDRLVQIVRANLAQSLALGGLVLVVVVAWFVESSGWHTRHR